METTSGYIAAAGAFLGTLIVVALYHFLVVRGTQKRLGATLTAHDALLGGSEHGGESRLTGIEAELQATKVAIEGLQARIAELEARSSRDLSRAGFVRYDAFDDTKSDLSYALALLNREGDGVVISSIYSRTDTRTYGKAVAKYAPLANASQEELHAIERAKSSGMS
ncbi:MAG: DUF4446 family protein [Vulcanimicrobiaceae bacterium]